MERGVGSLGMGIVWCAHVLGLCVTRWLLVYVICVASGLVCWFVGCWRGSLKGVSGVLWLWSVCLLAHTAGAGPWSSSACVAGFARFQVGAGRG